MIRVNENDILVAEIPRSDAVVNCQYRGGKDSCTCSYYAGDDLPSKENVKKFMANCEKMYIAIASVHKAIYTLDQILSSYIYIFKGTLSDYKKARSFFLIKKNDIEIDKFYTTGERGYYTFNNKDDTIIALKNILFTKITRFEIRKVGTVYYLDVKVSDCWRDEIMKVKMQKSDLISTFNDYMYAEKAKGKSEKIAAIVFGVKYNTIIGNSNVEIDELVHESKYDDAELIKAINLGKRISPDVIWETNCSDGSEPNCDDNDVLLYSKFKNLCGWFVKQLDINNGLVDGVKTSGQGYKDGSAIREQYKNWRDYCSFTLDCNIIAGYQSTFSKVNYINKTNTGINIRPRFDRDTKKVKGLYIDVYNVQKDLTEDIEKILEKDYEVEALSLFDDTSPNSTIIELFNDFKTVMDYFDEGEKCVIENYSKENFLKDVFMSEEVYDSLYNLMMYKKNVLLQGAPGVGKTFLAKKFAYSIIGSTNDDQVEMIQFHQNFSYEDFIMGYKPNEAGFKLENGIFYNFCQKAKKYPEKKFFFIIDEINRGNLSKIFGELMMLIEGDKRGEKVKLAYKDEEFCVPKNVYLLGMMNTADRSLAIMDYALRRRFSFFDISPAFNAPSFKTYITQYISVDLAEKIISKFQNLNKNIADESTSGLGKGYCIGHSYFCVPPIEGQNEQDWYDSIIKYEITPLLYEYWWDDQDKANDCIKELIK